MKHKIIYTKVKSPEYEDVKPEMLSVQRSKNVNRKL